MTTTVGTDAFKAPEFYQRDQQRKIHYHRNVDIYALGLTYLAMVQENKSLVPQIGTPGQDSELHAPIDRLIAERIKYGKEPLAIFPKSDVKDGKHIRSLIAKMTCHIPTERIAADGVIKELKEMQRYGCELACSVSTENSHENKVNFFYQNKILNCKIWCLINLIENTMGFIFMMRRNCVSENRFSFLSSDATGRLLGVDR